MTIPFRTATATIALAGAVSFMMPAAEAQERWDMPVAYPASNYHTEYVEEFASLVNEKTDGAIEITVHPGGSLYSGDEIKRAIQTGQAELGERLISALANEDPLFGLDAIPFLATDFESSWNLYEASRPALEDRLEQDGLRLLYAVPWPPQGLYANMPLEQASDMEGVRFRAYNPATARLAELMGADPTQIEEAELAQAFSTGTVESMISSGATGYDRQLWEHTSHFYDVQAWLPKNMVFINMDVWDGLDPDHQDAILEAAAEAEEGGWARAEELAEWYKEQLADNGMSVEAPSEQLAADLAEFGEVMTEEWLEQAGDVGAEVIERYNEM